jgi:hypothetical protein
VAGHLALDLDGHLADRLVEQASRSDDAWRSALVPHHLHERDQVRRVERVPENQARRVRPAALQLAESQPRRRGGDDHIVGKDRLDRGVQVVLRRDPFGDALLHELGTVDRGTWIVADDQSGLRLARQRQAEPLQHRPRRRDGVANAPLGGRVGVEDRDGTASCQEERGPAPTDEPAAEGGDGS